MNSYSETLREHCRNPRNRNPVENPDAVGMASLHGQSPHVVLYLYARSDQIVDAKFQASGCGVAIACASMLTILIIGRRINECAQICVADLVDALDGMPVEKQFCAELTIEALRLGLSQLQEQRPSPSTP